MEPDPKTSPPQSPELAEPTRGTSSQPAPAGRAEAGELLPPRLPVRAAIYIAPDGTVHFGALFQELAKVAESLGHAPDEAVGK